jgi:hypothetical protein
MDMAIIVDERTLVFHRQREERVKELEKGNAQKRVENKASMGGLCGIAKGSVTNTLGGSQRNDGVHGV